MKYYLAIVQNDATQAIYAYDGIDAALAAYHSELAYRAESRVKTLCVIFDNFGNTVYKECWEKYVAPTETEGS